MVTSLLLGRDVEGRDTEQSQTIKKSQTTQTCPGGQDGAMGSLKKGPVGISGTFCCRG